MAKKKAPYWAWGERRQLADKADTTDSHLSQILRRSITPGVITAVKLHTAAGKIGKDIPVVDWLNNKLTRHPAFCPGNKR